MNRGWWDYTKVPLPTVSNSDTTRKMSFVKYLDEMVAAMGVEGARSFVNQHLNTLATKAFFGAAFQTSFTPASPAAEPPSVPPTPPPEAEVVVEKESDASGSEGSGSQGKKSRRNFSKMNELFSDGDKFYVTSLGDRWDVELTKNDAGHLVFKRGEETYASPSALCKAHASRITERHPAPTAPGLPWKYIRIAEGENKDKSIGEIYDAHFPSA